MPDPTTPGGEMPAGAPSAPTTPPASPAATQTPPATQDVAAVQDTETGEAFDPERAMALIRKLRAEAKTATASLKELETLRTEKQQREDAELSERDRLAKEKERVEAERDGLRRDMQERTNRYEVQLHAAKLGIVDPEAAVKLLDWGALEYDAEGRPSDVDQALKQLVKDRPYLAGQAPGQPSAAPTNPATRAANPSARIYTAAELADREFYSAHRDDIVKAYREGRVTN